MIFAAIGVSGLGIALVGGTGPAMLAIGLSIAAAGLALAAAAWRRARPVGTHDLSDHWWNMVAAGAATLATLAGVTTLTGELSEAAWWPAVVTSICALALLGTGLMLGIAHHLNRRARHASS